MGATVVALKEEIRIAADGIEEKWGGVAKASSVFIGGGTPSLLPVDDIREVLAEIEGRFSFASQVEITLEVNPETVSSVFCSELASKTPVNRISLGAQSFQPGVLKLLERRGSVENTYRAVERLREYGFGNISLDILFGIPGEASLALIHDLEQATLLRPEHISFYLLTLKASHPLFGELPDEDLSADLFEQGIAFFKDRGFIHYEISNFAKPGFESRHNLLYWDGGDFLGIGPSAASRFFRQGRFYHKKHPADLVKYLNEDKQTVEFDPTTPFQTVLEACFLELRKKQGVSLKGFSKRYGYDLSKAKNYGLFRNQGLLMVEGDNVFLSQKGMLLADYVSRELVDAEFFQKVSVTFRDRGPER